MSEATADPASGRPDAGAAEVDPLTVALIRGQLEQVVDEMDTVFERMAFSPVISDAWDRADGIYAADDGAMVVQGERGLPIFVGVMQYAVRSVIDVVERFEEGDVYLLNDPYLGGTHLMDVKMVKPFFCDGELFAFLANTGHWADVGGRVPGGFSTQATEIYQEGLRLPPVRLFHDGRIASDVVSIVRLNSRVPDDCEGDLHAQAAALAVGEERLREVVERHGPDTVLATIDQLSEAGERIMRSHIAEIPDGRYAFSDVMDNDGVDEEPLEIHVEVDVSGSDMVLDFAGSSPPCRGPMNSVLSATLSSAVVALKHLFPDCPLNAGIFAPLEFRVPKETFLNAEPPRPVSGCAAEVSQRIITAVHGALAEALPELVPAASFATVNNFSMGGASEDGEPYVMYLFLGGGYGAARDGDGLANGCSLMSIARTQSLEVLEERYPIRFRRFALREGSGGAGRRRGGLGVVFEFELVGEEASASLLGDRARTPPQGVLGGREGAPARPYLVIDGRRTTLELITKGEGIALRRGDVVCLQTPGGGGYGPPSEREPEAVAADVASGFVSADALDLYAVVLDGSGAVDERATRATRAR